MMRGISNSTRRPDGGKNLLESQPCIKAIKKANFHPKLRKEINAFIQRNVLSDCGRVPPNCQKAHMIKTDKKINMPEKKVKNLKKLFIKNAALTSL